MTTATRCRDCAHAGEWSRTPTGRIRDKSAVCLFVVVLPPLPNIVTIDQYRIAIWPNAGAGCPTFTPIPAKP